jgi:hypothetical protein
MTDELTRVINMVRAQHQKLIRNGELICSLAPTGNDPVEKAKRVKTNIPTK